MSSDVVVEVREQLLVAARERLLEDGHAALSTRRVADAAGVPLSQIHYYFGGRQGLVLALLEREDRSLLARQQEMYAADRPLSERYDQACDYLEADLASGYVRLLQEMIAAGWSDPVVADKVEVILTRWLALLESVARDAVVELGPLGPFDARDVATLVGAAFLGGEAMLLLSAQRWSTSVLGALRRVGDLIRLAEEASAAP